MKKNKFHLTSMPVPGDIYASQEGELIIVTGLFKRERALTVTYYYKDNNNREFEIALSQWIINAYNYQIVQRGSKFRLIPEEVLLEFANLYGMAHQVIMRVSRIYETDVRDKYFTKYIKFFNDLSKIVKVIAKGESV